MSFGSSKWARYLPVAIVVAIGTIGSIAAYFSLSSSELKRLINTLDEVAVERTLRFENKLQDELEIGESIVHMFGAIGVPTRSEFSTFTAPFMADHPHIQALEWIPRVSKQQREEHESKAIADGLTQYEIGERDEIGVMLSAKSRQEYFPVYYAEPLDPNRGAIGLDLGSLANRREALESARDTGSPMVSERLKLQQGGEGVLTLIPIYASGSTPNNVQLRRDDLIGYSAIVFNVGAVLIDSIQSDAPAGVDSEILDISAPTELQLLHAHPSRSRPAGEAGFETNAPSTTKLIEFAGRQWAVTITAAPKFLADHSSSTPLTVMLAGLLFTAIIGLFGFREAKYSVTELAKSKDALAREAAELATVLERLKTESGLLSAVVDSAVDGIVTIDEDGTILTANQATYSIFGYEPGELKGKNVRVLMPNPYKEEHDKYLNNYYESGNPKIIGKGRELVGLHRDGTEFPLELGVSETSTPQGKIFTGVLRDITLRKESEKKFRSLNENLENIVTERTKKLVERKASLNEAQRMAGVGNWELNLVTNELTWSDEIFRIFELDKENFSATYEAFLNAIHPEDRAAVNEAYTESLKTRESYGITHRLLMSDGRVKFVHEQCQSSFDKDGKALISAGTIQDITERKKIEQEIRQLNTDLELRVRDRTEQFEIATREAKKANQAKSEFLSRMSHELRTPLNGILGFAQLIDISYDDPTLKEHTAQIIGGGKHLLNLINEILDMARIESGKLQISIEPVAISEVITKAVDLVSPLAEQKEITIEIGATCKNLHVIADRQRLVQVFINLLSNAIKYNQRDGKVEIHCGDTDIDKHTIEITNTGPGINEDEVDLLFIPFERLGTQHQEGTGLGLPLSQQLITLMGGELEFISSREDETVFGIKLKKSASPVEPAAPIKTVASDDNQKLAIAAKVLCIEDNLSSMRLIEHIFAGWKNATFIPAMQGSIGLELASEHNPDIILLDVHLPDMDGLDVLKTLRADPRTSDIAVVVISADATETQMKRLMAAGAHSYLSKPLDITLFKETLDDVLAPIAAQTTN